MSEIETKNNTFMRDLKKNNKYEVEFHQAVEGVVESVLPWYLDQKHLVKNNILERLCEPDRIISFKVVWESDNGEVNVNRGYRVQFDNTIGPYKGGLRFHPSVDQSVLKFLGFEQIFKNSLTGLPMGGAKGGADFNPKGKSDSEIMRFCQSFMTELHRHIGENVDVPAGDIGVGSREISYLFGHYKRLENRWAGVMTGKECSFGGSAVRKEATGYGCVYFCEYMLNHIDQPVDNLEVAISGSGNVALYAAEKSIHKNMKVITMSDSSGYIYIKDGLSEEQLKFIINLKEVERGRIKEAADKFDEIEFHEGAKPWEVKCDIAMPCATQNEITEEDAKTLVSNKTIIVCEGANMPLTLEAEKALKNSQVLHAPGKASNAGGVAVSGLEQSQNAMHIGWEKDRVDDELKSIMKKIHDKCIKFGKDGDKIDYVKGANLAGFEKVAKALAAFGIG